MDPPTLAYVVRHALTHHNGRSINDELLQIEQGEREQLVRDVEDVLRRRRDDKDQEAPMPCFDPFSIRPVERDCICPTAEPGEPHSLACAAAFKAKLLQGKTALRTAFDRRLNATSN